MPNRELMESEEKVGVRELFVNLTQELRFAKRQQWSVGYFVILAHAALAGFYNLLAARSTGLEEPARLVILGIAFVTNLAGVFYLASCQDWMRKSRTALREIYRHFATEEFLSARGGSELSVSFWKHGFVLFGLAGAADVSTSLLTWYVFQDFALAVKVFFLVFVLSLLVPFLFKPFAKP